MYVGLGEAFLSAKPRLTISQKGLKEPYDWDEYAEMFFPKAQELEKTAAEAESAGEKDKASEYYLYVKSNVYVCLETCHHTYHFLHRRSSAVFRIARFPAPRSEKQRLAWKLGKAVFYKGAAYVLLLEHLSSVSSK